MFSRRSCCEFNKTLFWSCSANGVEREVHPVFHYLISLLSEMNSDGNFYSQRKMLLGGRGGGGMKMFLSSMLPSAGHTGNVMPRDTLTVQPVCGECADLIRGATGMKWLFSWSVSCM